MDSSYDASEPETQFVPQDDDAENLWHVIEVVAETKKSYKVKWEGNDPATGKPWAPSWVPKHDCTPDLVVEWKKKKARRRSSASAASKHDKRTYSSRSTSKTSSSKVSPAKSTSTNRTAKGNSSTPGLSKAAPPSNNEWDEPPKAGPSKLTGKRKHSTITNSDADDDLPNSHKAQPRASLSSSHPPKKRKMIPNSSDVSDQGEESFRVHKKPSAQKKATVNTPRPSTSSSGRGQSKFVHVESESEVERQEREKVVSGSGRGGKGTGGKSVVVAITSPSRFPKSPSKSNPGSGSGSGSKVNKGKASSSLPLRRHSSSEDLDTNPEFDSRLPTPEIEPPSILESDPELPSPLELSRTAKARREESKPKKPSLTKRGVRKGPLQVVEDPEGEEVEVVSPDELRPRDVERDPSGDEDGDGGAEEEEEVDGFKAPGVKAKHRTMTDDEEVEETVQSYPPSEPEIDEQTDAEVKEEEEEEEEEEEKEEEERRFQTGRVSMSKQTTSSGSEQTKNSRSQAPLPTVAPRSTAKATVPYPAKAPTKPSPQPAEDEGDHNVPISVVANDGPDKGEIAKPINTRTLSRDHSGSSTERQSKTQPSKPTMDPLLKSAFPKEDSNPPIPRSTPQREGSSGRNSREAPTADPPTKASTASNPPTRTASTEKRHLTPLLSPAALKRLAEFDAFLASLPLDPIPSLTLPLPVNSDNARSPVLQHPSNGTGNNKQLRDRSSHTRSKDQAVTDPNSAVVPEPNHPQPSQPEIPSPSPVQPKRSTIVSRMKGRSPTKPSRTSFGPSLYTLPRMSGTQFVKAITSAGQTLSQGQESTIQQFDDSTTAEASASQIEQFSSPVKPNTPSKGGGLSSLMKGKRSSPVNGLSLVDEVDVRQRGEALAEKHRKQELLERNGGETQKKRRVESIQAERLNAREKLKVAFVPTPSPEDAQVESQTNEDDHERRDEVQEHHAFSQPTQVQQTPVQEDSQESNDTTGVQQDSSQMDIDDYNLQYPQLPEDDAGLLPTQDSTTMMIPATASDRHDTPPPSHPTDHERRRETDLTAAMKLLNEKSEEISRLETAVSEEQEKNRSLTGELDSCKKALAQVPGTSDLSLQVVEFQRQLEELRAANESLTTSLATANAAKEAAEKDKIYAEKDKEVFREQYARASAFVSSVQDENVELKKRVQIAETQAKDGVALIKATYERRQQDLQADVQRWQQVAKFAIEKDMRTNDEVRRKAAEEPELRRKCEELKAELENADFQLEEAETAFRQKEEERLKLEVEVGIWKEELQKLKNEREVDRGVIQGGRAVDHETNEDDEIFRCRWVMDGDAQPCSEVFKTRAELEAHIRSGVHMNSGRNYLSM